MTRILPPIVLPLALAGCATANDTVAVRTCPIDAAVLAPCQPVVSLPDDPADAVLSIWHALDACLAAVDVARTALDGSTSANARK